VVVEAAGAVVVVETTAETEETGMMAELVVPVAAAETEEDVVRATWRKNREGSVFGPGRTGKGKKTNGRDAVKLESCSGRSAVTAAVLQRVSVASVAASASSLSSRTSGESVRAPALSVVLNAWRRGKSEWVVWRWKRGDKLTAERVVGGITGRETAWKETGRQYPEKSRRRTRRTFDCVGCVGESVRESANVVDIVRIAVLVRPNVVGGRVGVGRHDWRTTRVKVADRRSATGVDDVANDGGSGRSATGDGIGACAGDGVAAGKGGKKAGDDLVDLRGLVALVRLVVEIEDSAFEKEETSVNMARGRGRRREKINAQ
jgi:hypothetical protein